MSEQAAEAMTLPKHGEFCWTEIATDNLEKSKTFYENVFGWEFKKSGAVGTDFEYLEFGNQGGLFEMKPEFYRGETPAPHINNYVSVDDVDEIARQTFELGGKIVTQPEDVPNVGRICQIEDPTGAKFFVITLKF